MTDVTIDLLGPDARIAAIKAREAAASVVAARAEVVLASAQADRADAALAATQLAEGLAEAHALASAASSAESSRAAVIAAAASATAPQVYATVAAGLAAVANGATFWAQDARKVVTLYRRTSAAAAAVITTLGDETHLRLSRFATPDAKVIRSASIEAGSKTLTALKPVFGAEDVGKLAIVTDAGAQNKLATSITAYLSPTQVTLAQAAITAMTDKGVSIGSDCGPGLNAAFAALEAQCGGTLVFDGVYLLRSPASLLAKRAQHLHLVGTGGDSGIIVAGQRDSEPMIRLDNIGRLLVEGLNFAGTFGEADDCRRLFFISNAFARFVGNGFFGLACVTNTAAAAIHAEQADLDLRNNEFGGCVFSSGNDNAVVNSQSWIGYRSQGNRWIDYGSWLGELYSKTGIAFSGAWVTLGAQKAEVANATGQSAVRFTDDRFDEGHVSAVSVNAGEGRVVSRVIIDGCQVNNTLIEGGSALFLRNIEHVEILRSAIGFTPHQRDALALTDVGEAVIDRLMTGGGATGLNANRVGSIKLADSPGLTNLTLVGVDRFSRSERGMGGVVVQARNGRITDADFAAPPPIGTTAADVANRKLYLKTALVDGWVATAALAPSDDPLLALRNATPQTGQLIAGDTYRKTAGGDVWGNCSAIKEETVTGDFRMRVRFPTGSDETYVRVGAIDATLDAGTVVPQEGIICGILQNDANQVYFVSGGLYVGPYPYTPGQVCELTSDAATGAVRLLVNGIEAYTGQHALGADFAHRFGSTIYSVGGEFQLLEYGPA